MAKIKLRKKRKGGTTVGKVKARIKSKGRKKLRGTKYA